MRICWAAWTCSAPGRSCGARRPGRNRLAGADTPAQADALTDAIRLAAEEGDHVTSDQFKAGQAEVRAEIANLDTRLSTQMSRIEAELKSDMKLLKFGYGPVVLGLLRTTSPDLRGPSR